MKLHNAIRVNASLAEAWRLLGPDYVRAGDWASGVYVSSPRVGGQTLPGAPVVGRVCESSIGPVTETITEYDQTNHRIAYEAQAEGMPSFVRSLHNVWSLTASGPDQTDVEMVTTLDLAPPFNVLMGWMMRLQLGGLLKQSIEEFKHFAETGQPHPRKVKSARSKKGLAAQRAAAA